MRKPTQIKIGGFIYKVKYKRTVGDHLGITYIDKKLIVISKHDNIEVLKETLIHELLHVLMEDVIESVDDKKDLAVKEEAIIRFVSPRLFQTFKENPKLVAFLFG